jgi:cell volume regulation protein A
VLGLTVDLAELTSADVWIPGLVIGVVLAAVVRPVFVGLCLIPARLKPNERTFVLFAGLKGAVPILLGSFILAAHVPGAERLYGIVVIVVVLSVLVQGSLVPTVAAMLHLPTRATAPEPWALGVRLADEPDGVQHLTIGKGAPADGRRIADLPMPGDDAWISLVVRDHRLLPVRGESLLRAGDEVLVIATPDQHDTVTALFAAPGPDDA